MNRYTLYAMEWEKIKGNLKALLIAVYNPTIGITKLDEQLEEKISKFIEEIYDIIG